MVTGWDQDRVPPHHQGPSQHRGDESRWQQCGSAYTARAEYHPSKLVRGQQTRHLLHKRRPAAAKEKFRRHQRGRSGHEEHHAPYHRRDQYLRFVVARYETYRIPQNNWRRELRGFRCRWRRLESAQPYEEPFLRRLAGVVARWQEDRVRIEPPWPRLPDFRHG